MMEINNRTDVREVWVDNVKSAACVLVVLGHFFQSMVKAGILPGGHLYQWFNQTIYYFHVPLFFYCSGYLYQKYSRIDNARAWTINLLKKFVVLGIPYATFTTVTWVLKSVFSDSVNDEIGGLLQTLICTPTSPYWYLYVLFFIFMVTPTFLNKGMACLGLAVSLGMKMLSFRGGGSIYAVSSVLANEIWFVLGMELCAAGFLDVLKNKKCFRYSWFLFVVFMLAGIAVYQCGIKSSILKFLLGLIACNAIIMMIATRFQNNIQPRYLGFFAKYTMPVFLMHTLFAAPLRSLLLKLGIADAGIHVGLGIIISFLGPITAAEIINRVRWMEFFLYPGKYIKIG